MLDQNTDRMWFVIGAVIVGAAIIFIANGTLPTLFASVSDTFNEASNDVTAQIAPNENLNIQLGNDIGAYSGSTLTVMDRHYAVPEWNTKHATRVVTSGGTNTIKGIYTMLPWQMMDRGERYTQSIYVKNLGIEQMQFTFNMSEIFRIEPGEQRRLVASFSAGSTNSQIQFRTLGNADMDFVYWAPKIEEGDMDTPFVSPFDPNID